MLTLALLIDRLGDHVARQNGFFDKKTGIVQVVLPDGRNTPYEPGSLLVGIPADRDLLPQLAGEAFTAADTGLPILWACGDAGLGGELEGICTDLPLAALLNTVLAVVRPPFM